MGQRGERQRPNWNSQHRRSSAFNRSHSTAGGAVPQALRRHAQAQPATLPAVGGMAVGDGKKDASRALVFPKCIPGLLCWSRLLGGGGLAVVKTLATGHCLFESHPPPRRP